MSYELKIRVDCSKAGEDEWGSTTTHEVRKLDYAELVEMQRELVDALTGLLLGYGETKVQGAEVPAEPMAVEAPKTYR